MEKQVGEVTIAEHLVDLTDDLVYVERSIKNDVSFARFVHELTRSKFDPGSELLRIQQRFLFSTTYHASGILQAYKAVMQIPGVKVEVEYPTCESREGLVVGIEDLVINGWRSSFNGIAYVRDENDLFAVDISLDGKVSINRGHFQNGGRDISQIYPRNPNRYQ